MKVISYSVFKGGTGKTTSAVNTAAALAEEGKKTLLIDLDQQASSTRHMGLDPDATNPNLYHVFTGNVTTSSWLILPPAKQCWRSTAWLPSI